MRQIAGRLLWCASLSPLLACWCSLLVATRRLTPRKPKRVPERNPTTRARRSPHARPVAVGCWPTLASGSYACSNTVTTSRTDRARQARVLPTWRACRSSSAIVRIASTHQGACRAPSAMAWKPATTASTRQPNFRRTRAARLTSARLQRQAANRHTREVAAEVRRNPHVRATDAHRFRQGWFASSRIATPSPMDRASQERALPARRVSSILGATARIVPPRLAACRRPSVTGCPRRTTAPTRLPARHRSTPALTRKPATHRLSQHSRRRTVEPEVTSQRSCDQPREHSGAAPCASSLG
jgi:hypothetical protein